MQKVFEIKKDRQKCVWMMAGMVNYRLCPSDYRCEKCEFDRVMRNLFPVSSQPGDAISWREGLNLDIPLASERNWLSQMANRYLMHLADDCPIHLDRCYHPTHLWSFPEKSDVVVGIDPLILKVLEPVSQVIFPEVGKNYQEGQLIAWLVRDTKTYPLRSPCSGKIIAANPEQIDIKNNWLFKINEKDNYQKVYKDYNLMQSLQLTANNIDLIRQYVVEGLKKNLPDENILTMADGGALEPDLKRVLGQKKYEELCNRIFQMK
jgi:glycine cleavage system H lipoate-binding protein